MGESNCPFLIDWIRGRVSGVGRVGLFFLPNAEEYIHAHPRME